MAATTDWLQTQETRYAEFKHGLRQIFDPFGLAEIWRKAQIAWLTHPAELSLAIARYIKDVSALQRYGMQRLLGKVDDPAFPPHKEDQRFADPVWEEDPHWDFLKQSYLLQTRLLQDMLYTSPGLCEVERRKSAFWLRQALNAFAPTNFLLTNPTAQVKAIESNGSSLIKGINNLVADMAVKDVTMTDRSKFKVGVSLGTTPGEVVFRNHMLEVIHYTPSTDSVHAVPMVLVTPWINKYYILDLTPAKSMIKYLVDQGFNVFVTSWKNPDASMAETKFDDYLTDGVGAIVKVAQSIAKSDKVHALGYCIGGTLLTSYMAWINRKQPDKVPVAHWTLLTTLTDFSAPGDIEVFIDEEGVAFIEKAMAKGYLDGQEMASSFRMLRANSLIWHYVVRNYLYGETPPPLDVLYWNTDMTRMPRAMHKFYLNELYLNNKLILPDVLNLAGQPIDLRRIQQPLFMAAAEEDHITPWKQTFRIVHYVNSRVLFTLSTSGHILGMVNPVINPPKRSYWQAVGRRGQDPDQWLKDTPKVAGSWWPSWVEWLRPQCGERIKPLPMSNKEYPKLADAPGQYVFE